MTKSAGAATATATKFNARLLISIWSAKAKCVTPTTREFHKLCANREFLKYFHTTISMTAISYIFRLPLWGVDSEMCAQNLAERLNKCTLFFPSFFYWLNWVCRLRACGVVNQRIISKWSDPRKYAAGEPIALTWLCCNWWWRRVAARLQRETNEWPAKKGRHI